MRAAGHATPSWYEDEGATITRFVDDLVAVVGERLKRTPGLSARIFAALRDINVEMISMGANEINLSLVVRREEADEALRRLHGALIEQNLEGGAA